MEHLNFEAIEKNDFMRLKLKLHYHLSVNKCQNGAQGNTPEVPNKFVAPKLKDVKVPAKKNQAKKKGGSKRKISHDVESTPPRHFGKSGNCKTKV
ncbi:unnamed protein product [Acanthoscelides obtectus]|uniref:Uncharacterized protein n=1 Tax=Acanthoscelides obtectus TaxID=200917 RepID=A0A9P0NY59_ACAOB|nr:unnamed protein product [Acanthoscelides obtectus]CAK1628060.1 hypothetical protein AOBTE_LOCUS4992 [Acanthoscelides obtectus]